MLIELKYLFISWIFFATFQEWYGCWNNINVIYICYVNHIPLFPWEEIVSKNQKNKSICKILQYEKSF